MKADLVAREPQRLKTWETPDPAGKNLYQRIQDSRAGREKFVLHDGPPFANGDVHIGTALNKILKDIIIKYQTLRGKSAPYIPGWDCHGLPIEFKVMQELQKKLKSSIPKSVSEQDIAKAIQKGGGPSPEIIAAVVGGVAARADDAGMMKLAAMADTVVIRETCEAYARKFIDLQRTQFKRLGVLGDWANPYLTLNKEYEADELRLFANIVEKGFVYRGKKPVYWSIPCRTALAEAEVEYQDHVSQSVYVKFPVVGQPKTFIVIWTTTPWTLPSNLAVAYNEKFQYVAVQAGDEKYIVFSGLVPVVAEKCGWKDYTQTPVSIAELSQLKYNHPFCKRVSKAYPADFVTADTGTGFVHIAPGHGLEDYGLGRQVNLPIYSPVDDDGRLAYTNDFPVEFQMPAGLIGKSILEKHGKSEANEAVLALLREKNVLLQQEDFHHSYPHCWRSKSPVIFRAMDQWFIKIDHECEQFRTRCEEYLKKHPYPTLPLLLPFSLHQKPDLRLRALAAIDEEVYWIPEWGKNRIEGAVKTRPDWCISRQRTWGVPLPAFYDAQSEPILDAQIVRNVADLIAKHGSNIWFEKTAAELWALVKPANWTRAEAVAKSNDTLDVWIDSGSSSRAVLKQRKELQHDQKSGDEVWQADVYLEGSDQHRGWFQSSLLLSLAGNGAVPFKTVLTHGFMVDADREKISKSKQGGYEKPQTAEAYVKKYGADVVRLWVASQDYRNDIVVSEERINKVGETYRAIRNALRYQLSNLYDFDPAKHTVPNDQLTGLDRWILGEFSKLETEVITAYDRYEFHIVYQKISQFVAVELSSIYHDVIKDRLYTDAANSPRRRSTQTALYRLVTGLCQMLAPILAFTADEAWEFVPGKPTASVHEANWKPQVFLLDDEEKKRWEMFFTLRPLVLQDLEAKRKSGVIGKALEAKVVVGGNSKNLPYVARNFQTEFRELINVSQFEEGSHDQPVPDGGSAIISIVVSKADGQKCARCWHWETDIGRNAEHPTLCGRCVEAVKQFKA
jgi:isoleucyl-tRNA synthetase